MQRDLYLGKHSKFKSSPFLISSVQSINLITKCLSQTQNKTFSVFSKRALVRFRDYLNKFKLWRKQRLGIHSFCPPVNLTLAHWLSRAFSNSQGVVSNEFSLIEIWTNIKITKPYLLNNKKHNFKFYGTFFQSQSYFQDKQT